MTEKESRKGSSKLSRSETVTVRLDPKLRYLAELASRKQRRTLSSFIEWAVEESLRTVILYHGTGYNGDDSLSVEDEVWRLWDVDESERFVRLAILYPELLNHQEQEIWKLIQDSELLSPACLRDNFGRSVWNWKVLVEIVFPTLRKHWPLLMAAYSDGSKSAREWVDKITLDISNGKIYSSAAVKNVSEAETNFDDDIPF